MNDNTLIFDKLNKITKNKEKENVKEELESNTDSNSGRGVETTIKKHKS